MIHPERLALGRGEGLAVEVAHEVLRSRSACGSAGVDVNDEHPLGFFGSGDGQLEEVGALPDALVAAAAIAKAAEVSPRLAVGRGIEADLVAASQ